MPKKYLKYLPQLLHPGSEDKNPFFSLDGSPRHWAQAIPQSPTDLHFCCSGTLEIIGCTAYASDHSTTSLNACKALKKVNRARNCLLNLIPKLIMNISPSLFPGNAFFVHIPRSRISFFVLYSYKVFCTY